MADLPSYSEEAVQAAIDSARNFYAEKQTSVKASAIKVGFDDGHVSTLAECISVTIQDGKACLNLPLGFGSVCIPVPNVYNGQVASACLSICTTWGFPTGVRVSVIVAGITIVSQTFGKC